MLKGLKNKKQGRLFKEMKYLMGVRRVVREAVAEMFLYDVVLDVTNRLGRDAHGVQALHSSTLFFWRTWNLSIC